MSTADIILLQDSICGRNGAGQSAQSSRRIFDGAWIQHRARGDEVCGDLVPVFSQLEARWIIFEVGRAHVRAE